MFSEWSQLNFEPREDIRLPSSKAAAQQRSINLAISARGIAAIQAIDPAAADRFLSTVIPMRGRMIHDPHGRQQSQPYDRDGQVSPCTTRRLAPCPHQFIPPAPAFRRTPGRPPSRARLGLTQCINSIGRAFLNEDLLGEALAVPSIRVFFQHKVIGIDFDRKQMSVRDVEGARDVIVPFDFCVGADGSYSIVRRQLMRVVRYVPSYRPRSISIALSAPSRACADPT